MNALDNANIEKPRSGLASFAFPEAKSSKTGVSVGYVPSPDRRWYVLRIKYGKARASGTDDKARIIPKVVMSLEECLEYIKEDELVEVTPKSMRMRKIILDHDQRKKASRA